MSSHAYPGETVEMRAFANALRECLGLGPLYGLPQSHEKKARDRVRHEAHKARKRAERERF